MTDQLKCLVSHSCCLYKVFYLQLFESKTAMMNNKIFVDVIIKATHTIVWKIIIFYPCYSDFFFFSASLILALWHQTLLKFGIHTRS